MTSYYPVQCEICKKVVCYSDVDFKDTDNINTCVWCSYCMEMKPKMMVQK